MVFGASNVPITIQPPAGNLAQLLANGGVARGVVTQTTATGVIARVGGETINLPANAQLQTGSTFLLRNDGGTWQLVPMPAGSATPASPTGASPTLAQALANMGVPNGTAQQVFAQSLLAADLPVNSAWINGLTQVLGNAVTPQDWGALVFMLSRGISISSGSLSEVRRLLQVRDDLGGVLAQISQWGASLPAGTAGQIPELLAGLDQLFLTLGGQGNLQGAQLAQSITQSGAGLEQLLLMLASPGAAGQLAHSALADLRALLGKLLQALEQHGELPDRDHLRQLVQRGLSLSEAVQLANVPPRQTPAAGHWHYFQIPLRWDDESTTVELAYREKRRQDADGPSSTQSEVMLQISLTQWGPVRAFLLKQDQRLTVVLTVGTRQIADLVSRARGQLAEALGQLEFADPEIRVTVRDLHDERVWDLVLGPADPGALPAGLDLHA